MQTIYEYLVSPVKL